MATSNDLFQHPNWFILDIRTAEERFGDLGFIPGSIWVDTMETSFENNVLDMASKHPVVLTCLSDKRSKLHTKKFQRYTQHAPIDYLEGGLLNWIQHYPIAGVDVHPHPNTSKDPKALFMNLRACFIGQITESMLDLSDVEFENPVELLEQCFRQVGTTSEQATTRQWYKVLDYMAHMSKTKQTAVEDIARHIDEFLGWFPKGLQT